MKTNLTGEDLLALNDILIEAYKIQNFPYRKNIVKLWEKIHKELSKIKIELREK